MKIKIFAIISVLFFISCGKGKETYQASGVFEATEVMVSSEANGKILSLDIQEGQQISIGNEY